MKKNTLIILKFIILITPISSFATTQQSIKLQDDKSNYLFWILLVIALTVIAVYGVYKNNKRDITVFANLTDVGFVIASAVIPIISLIIMYWMGVSPNIMIGVCCTIFVIFLIAIAKATFLYNDNILHTLLALYTKMFIPVIAIACIIIALLISISLKRNKYERKTSHSKRVNDTALAGFSSAFLIISLVLHNEKFVTISDYLSGKD